jgi:phage replication-related protein YjqB (UPF0714/DUF867 family)
MVLNRIGHFTPQFYKLQIWRGGRQRHLGKAFAMAVNKPGCGASMARNRV